MQKLPKRNKAKSSKAIGGHDSQFRRTTWLCKARERVLHEQEMKAVSIKRTIGDKIQSITGEIDSLLLKCDNNDDIETAERSYFIIDEKRHKNRLIDIQGKVKNYRESITREIEDNLKVTSELQKNINNTNNNRHL